MKTHTGIAIALAWPNTYCKQVGVWYDHLMRFLRISHNDFYKVGHAAVILIDIEKAYCHYFDFGRYHAPFQHGRVRSMETDFELKFLTRPKFSKSGLEIENIDAILTEIQATEACHGDGLLHASYVAIDFKRAYAKAIQMQQESPMLYGPFQIGGSNCSRFVNTVILAGKPHWWNAFRMRFVQPFSPSPLLNVKALPNYFTKKKQYKEVIFTPVQLSKEELRSTKKAPKRHKAVPKNAQWLSGEGAGSWFAIEKNEDVLQVERYSPNGILECTGFYQSSSPVEINSVDQLEITYPSTCKAVYFKIKSKIVCFERLTDREEIKRLAVG